MSIGGKRRGSESNTGSSFQRKCGMMECTVVAFNPDREKFAELTGNEPKEESKMFDYLGEKDGNTTLRLNIWMKESKTGELFNTSIFLEDKIVMNKIGDKTKYINSRAGIPYGAWTLYVNKEENLSEKFRASEYRKAHVGEEELVGFLEAWLNFERGENYNLLPDWQKLMNGDMKELNTLLRSDLPRTITAMSTIRVTNRDGERKEYQGVYNRKFLPGYAIKFFNTIDFSNTKLTELKKKNEVSKETKQYLKAWEKFAVEVTDEEYGCNDHFSLKPLHDYDPNENPLMRTTPIKEDDSSY